MIYAYDISFLRISGKKEHHHSDSKHILFPHRCKILAKNCKAFIITPVDESYIINIQDPLNFNKSLKEVKS